MNTTLHTQNQQYNKKSSFDEASTIDSHHSVDPQDYKRKFKMEVCKAWRDNGLCWYGDQCAFAHGQHQLRDRALISTSKYKTKMCTNFLQKGCCCYGKRCQFSHRITKKSEPIIHFQRRLSFVCEIERFQAGVFDLQDLAQHTESLRPNVLKQLSEGIPVSE